MENKEEILDKTISATLESIINVASSPHLINFIKEECDCFSPEIRAQLPIKIAGFLLEELVKDIENRQK
jgi:hypothetical protein